MHVFPAPGCGQNHTLYIYMYVHECMLFKLYTCTLKYKKNQYTFWGLRTEYICWYFYNDYIEFIITAGK